MTTEPMTTEQMTMPEFIALLHQASTPNVADAIADVGAMLGQCATMTGGRDRTIADVRGRYVPKSELGREIQAIVLAALAESKAKRAQAQGGAR